MCVCVCVCVCVRACVCVCVCAFTSRKDFCYTHKHRSCAVSVPGACDLSTIIRIDIEEEIISVFTHAFGHLGNKITVGEDYGFGLVNQSFECIPGQPINLAPLVHI